MALPFSEGGLNLKHIDDWNNACIILHLWNIVNPRSNSLWALWIKNTVIKDKHFWCIPIPADCSWIWRKVLKSRDIAVNFISFDIGNGSLTSLWFDPWIRHSPLASSCSDPIIVNSGLGPRATVADILGPNGWCLPESNHTDVIEFRRSFDFMKSFNFSNDDCIIWDSAHHVTVSIIWQSIRKKAQAVDWADTIWHSLSVPRFSFFLWLAFHKGLRTKDVLCRFGILHENSCLLCPSSSENFHHLFFSCPFAFSVFFMVMRFCGWKGSSGNWGSVSNFILQFRGSKLQKSILSLGLAASVYAIWRERNARLFGEPPQNPVCIGRRVTHLIKCRLLGHKKFRLTR